VAFPTRTSAAHSQIESATMQEFIPGITSQMNRPFAFQPDIAAKGSTF
jgi:hypothetical protein